jgi:hypothetical protein
MKENYNFVKGTECLEKLTCRQLKNTVDLYKSTVNVAIYSTFLLNGCGNYVIGLKNGLVLTFYDFEDDDFIRFKIEADDKVIIKGTMQNILDSKYEVAFAYPDNLCYTDRDNFESLKALVDKWRLVNKLVDLKNCLLI